MSHTHTMPTWKGTDPPNDHELLALALMFRSADRLNVIDLIKHGGPTSAVDPVVGMGYLEARGWVQNDDVEYFLFTDRFREEAPHLQGEEARRALLVEAEANEAIANAEGKRYTAHVLFVASARQARGGARTPLELREFAAALTEDLTELLDDHGFEGVEELKDAVQACDVVRAMNLASRGFDLVPRDELLGVLERHSSAHLLRRDGEINPDARAMH